MTAVAPSPPPVVVPTPSVSASVNPLAVTQSDNPQKENQEPHDNQAGINTQSHTQHHTPLRGEKSEPKLYAIFHQYMFY